MKIKYQIKNIEINLKDTRIFCKLQTKEEKEEFIQLAGLLGYSSSVNIRKMQLPIALFIGQEGRGSNVAHGAINYNYSKVEELSDMNYKELSIEKFRKLMKDGCIKKE